MSNIVAIVGRPNVGKSTLFNRFIESRQAIMDDQSGVTRDRQYGMVEWNGRKFTAIDTGGFVDGSNETFEKAIRVQVLQALEEANVILFVVDSREGINPLDQAMAQVLRKSKKPVVIAANKSDTYDQILEANEFYNLGFPDVFTIASSSGYGTGELLDHMLTLMPEQADVEEDELPRIAILGKPNVGKSSFLNVLLGEERTIVTDIEGTTRDAIDTHYKLYGKNFILTDTAGIRKKAKISEDLEFYSVMRSIKALQKADVCIIILDAQNGLQNQDMQIISLANRYKKGIILMVNKWDLIEKDGKTADHMTKEITEKLGTMSYIPIIYTSMLAKQRVFQAIELGLQVYENTKRKVPTSQLNKILLPYIEQKPPPSYRGKYINIKYITQLPTLYTTFAFFCNHPKHLPDSYTRFLENLIRRHFEFTGVSISLFYRKK